ncbi:RloB family protein, partial [Romboutsia ilealis]
MYDKDDFPLDNFDNTQYSAEKRKEIRKYRVAWSNECIELWFVLHFQ